jgi:hypothetical protein
VDRPTSTGDGRERPALALQAWETYRGPAKKLCRTPVTERRFYLPWPKQTCRVARLTSASAATAATFGLFGRTLRRNTTEQPISVGAPRIRRRKAESNPPELPSVQKAGNSNEKDNRKCGSLSSIDIFGSDCQRPRGQLCIWGPLKDRSCGSHAGGSYSQTVHCAFPRLEAIKRHPAGTESCCGGAKFACERHSACTAEPDRCTGSGA